MKLPTKIIVILFILASIVIACSLREQPLNPTPQPFQNIASIPIENNFCLGGCPKGMTSTDIIVIHHILELSNNPTTKFADWVAYNITATSLGSGCARKWETDPDLDPTTTLKPSDYRGLRQALASDRGHQAPLASLCGLPYWQEADYLSNITPQKTDLNEGAWERLEMAERSLIQKNLATTVYSLTGTLYERDMAKLPYAHTHHVVPSGYWKIISIINSAGFKIAGFIMDQETPRLADFCSTHVTIHEIEQRAQLNFFPNLSSELKSSIENGDASQSLMKDLGC